MRKQRFSPHSRHLLRFVPAVVSVCMAVSGVSVSSSEAWSQAIAFETELPRTLVVIGEEDGAGVATRNFATFLEQADFPLVDPSLPGAAASAELVESALAGDDAAAVQLGRDFGAQVLIVGRVQSTLEPADDDESRITVTSDLDVRAVRLDREVVVATGHGRSRQIEASEDEARTAAVRDAASKVLIGSAFLGRIASDWAAEPWSSASYFGPDPGSVASAALAAARSAGTQPPQLAILSAMVAPHRAAGSSADNGGLSSPASTATDTSSAVHVRVEGIVIGPVEDVEVDGVPAELKPLEPSAAARLGLRRGGHRFFAEVPAPEAGGKVRVIARGPGERSAEALVSPRVNRRWAVVIGVGSYTAPDVADLPSAARDARAVYDFLRSQEGGAFPQNNMLLLTDEQANVRAVREALFVFLQQTGPDDLVVIYFAGHGAPDPSMPSNLYLLPSDADPDALDATALPLWDLKTALRRHVSAEQVVLLADAAHPGSTRGLDNPINGAFLELFNPSRRLTLTAAGEDEVSADDAHDNGHGLFTHYLLAGLRGEADADGDGVVTFLEIAQHVAAEVNAGTSGAQNPQFRGVGNLPLAVVF